MVVHEVAVANEVIVVDEPVVQMIGVTEDEAGGGCTGFAAGDDDGDGGRQKSDRTLPGGAGNKEKAKTEADATAEAKQRRQLRRRRFRCRCLKVILPAGGWMEYLSWVTKI